MRLSFFMQNQSAAAAVKRLAVFFTVFFVAGVALGAVFAAMEQADNTLWVFLQSMHLSRAQQSFLGVFALNFFSASILFGLIFFLGQSVFGTVFIPFLPLIQGIGIGGAYAFLYIQYGGQGIVMNAVMYMLPDCLQTVLLVINSASAFLNSRILYQIHISRKEEITACKTRGNAKLLLVSLALLVPICMLESVLCALYYAVAA